MYNVYDEKGKIYWIVDEDKFKITRVENEKQTEVKLTKAQKKIVIELVKHSENIIPEEALYSLYRDGYKSVDEQKESVRKRISAILEKDEKLRSMIKHKSMVGYQISGRIEKVSTTAPIKSEETLSKEFEDNLIEKAKSHIKSWELNNYEVEETLLPTCKCKTKTKDSLYDFIHIELKQFKMRNWVIESTGGSGKTSSLVYMCKKLLECDDRCRVIPIFIRVRDVDSNTNNPLCNYIYQHFADFTNPESIYNPEKIYLHNLEMYLRNNQNNVKLLIVLDGCNEGDDKCLVDLPLVSNFPNTMVILSTRIHSKKFDSFEKIQINELENQKVITYLQEHGISVEKSYDSKNLRLPIYLQMYTKICNARKDNTPTISISSQAQIIDEWIKTTYMKFSDEDLEFALELFLPILALIIYCDKTYNKHNEVFIDKQQRTNAYAKLIEIFTKYDFDFEDAGFKIPLLDIRKCIELFQNLIVQKSAFCQNEGYGTFAWSHECYRDWFIAKGLYVCKMCSDELFNYYFEILMTKKFIYPEVLQKHLDYPSFAVGVYLAELLKEEHLTTDKNLLYEVFLRNIAFIYEDIGDTVDTVLYGSYIEKRHKNKELKTLILQKCITLSGLAYSYLHFFNLGTRADCEDLIEKAHRMLEEAESIVSQIVSVKYDYDVSNEKLMKLKPDELAEFFDSNWVLNDGAKETNSFNINDSRSIWKKSHMVLEQSNIEKRIESLSEDDCEDINQYQHEICPLLAKIYGNFGSYYLSKYRTEQDEKYIVEAHKYHLIGAAYKYLILKSCDLGTAEFRDASNAFAVSMRSFAVDMYDAEQYELSLDYYKYALEYCEESDFIESVTRAYIVRSKIWHMITEYEKIGCNYYNMSELIDEELELLDYFKENYLFGEVDRMVSVVAEIITVYRMDEVNKGCYEKLVALIDKIVDIHREYFIADNSFFKLRSYLDDGGENLWRKNNYE